MEYLSYPYQFSRHQTRTVQIGNIAIGGSNPIVIQSMLTSLTSDVNSCFKEVLSLVNVGCQLIRLTVPSLKDLEYIAQLRYLMQEEGIIVPLVADVHFSPNIAVAACEFFEKVRINPGNYTDVSKNSKKHHSAEWFEEGRENLKEAIIPLVKQLKYYRRALRIGVNHGSLSTRMIEKYGDSPSGMVGSALEMINLFEAKGFDQLVVSLKSSNPVVVQKAYRLLVDHSPGKEAVPLHLGVTEAGNGIAGRVKGLAGIGSLLIDGIGDTIRVSLTEESQNEIVFAQKLLHGIGSYRSKDKIDNNRWQRELNHQRIINPSIIVDGIEIGNGTPLKLGILKGTTLDVEKNRSEIDFEYKIKKNNIFILGNKKRLQLPSDFSANLSDIPDCDGIIVENSANTLYLLRKHYKAFSINKPVGMFYPLRDSEAETLFLETQLSAILSEGLLDFLLIPKNINANQLERAFYLLQATRSKIFFPDYIACPSCGRTLFDLQLATQKIKKATSHLKGVKIGIMGCIVNGPGEMADADFGYVGSGRGKIDLYLGQQQIKKGVDEQNAVDDLVDLIKENGRWIDPPLTTEI
jgi:(E)-4-hydroxy-3-methylbut-2-enyl-diphosphate synthase